MTRFFFLTFTECSPCILTALAVSLGAVFFMSRYFFRRARHWNPEDRWVLALLPPSALIFACEIFYRILSAVFDEHSWIRLHKTFVLAMGKPLYYPLDSGPALATMYGPVSTLAYWPATLFDSPLAIMPAAQAIALAFAYLPVLWLHLGGRPHSQKSLLAALLSFLCFAAVTVRLTSLRSGLFIVHADAPTLGLGALACAFVYFRNKKNSALSLLGAALFSVLAVWSKQVAVPIIPALALYLGLTEGRKAVYGYLLWVLAVGLAVSLAFMFFFGAGNMFLHMFYIPSQHAYKSQSWTVVLRPFFRVTREWLVMLIWGVFSMTPHFTALFRGRDFGGWARENRWILFGLVGLFMMPVSILANIKVGGSGNTISHTNFFMMLAAALAFLSPVPPGSEKKFPGKFLSPRAAIALWAAIMIIVNLPFLAYRIVKLDLEENFALSAYEFVKKNPGRAYFPRLALIHILAEDRIYHDIDGLMDRHWAGFPVTEEHLRSHIPPRAEMIIFHDEDHQWLLENLPEFSVRNDKDPLWPDAVVYRREQV